MSDARDVFAAELAQADGVILFDGACAFCRNVVGHLLLDRAGKNFLVCSVRSPRGDIAARAMGQEPRGTFAFLTHDTVTLGVDAYIQILSLTHRWSWLGKIVALLPRRISDGSYRWIGAHRPLLSSFLGAGSHTAIPPSAYVADGRL